MQRLFSMFPRGAPGLALVVLRLAVAAALWSAGPAPHSTWMTPARLLLAVPLGLGFVTPAMAALCVAVHGAGLVRGEPALPAAIAMASAAALALLGPGAYSIDGRLFGRRVFVVSGGAP